MERSLREKFDAENAKDTSREHTQPNKILIVHVKMERQDEQGDPAGIIMPTHGLTFSARDPRPKGWKGDNPLIIQASIKNVTIHRAYIDTGSSADIIYEHCFRLLHDKWKENLRPTTRRLVGFIGHSIWPLGRIHLPLTLTSHDKQRRKTTLIGFVVIRHSAEHNIILGRTALLKLGAIPSTMHGIIKFSTTEGLATVLATPPKELQCFEVMQPAEIAQETKRARVEKANEKEVINLEYPNQPVSIGRNLPERTRGKLVSLLRQYKHVFTWTPTDMVGVDRKVIEHRLMIESGTKEVKQKKRVQGGD